MVRASWLQIIATSFLIGCLIFLWNIFLLVSYNADRVSDTITPKLWMYFYIHYGLTEEVAWSTLLNLMQDLEEAWLESSFFTSDQAFARLEQHLPAVLEDFALYWLENPLPATLYVMFKDEREFQLMKSIVMWYDRMITNTHELTAWIHFQDQERRIQVAINAMSFLQYGSLLLVWSIIIIIVWFLWYALSGLLVQFKEQVVLERLLGASVRQIIAPFLLYVFFIISVSYCLFLLAALFGIKVLDGYTLSLFQQTFRALAMPTSDIVPLLWREYVIILCCSLFGSSVIMRILLRRL